MNKYQIRNEIRKRERELKSASAARRVAIQNEIEYLKFLRTVR